MGKRIKRFWEVLEHNHARASTIVMLLAMIACIYIVGKDRAERLETAERNEQAAESNRQTQELMRNTIASVGQSQIDHQMTLDLLAAVKEMSSNMRKITDSVAPKIVPATIVPAAKKQSRVTLCAKPTVRVSEFGNNLLIYHDLVPVNCMAAHK